MSDELATTAARYIVIRSTVEKRQTYGEYLPELRLDFWYSCAYCTLCESEARAISFSIDHYEAKGGRPDLLVEYTNLMYSCEVCNRYKWKYSPPKLARLDGVRFFKADVDDAAEHFAVVGDQLQGLTNTGKFTVLALDLNRAQLKRLRKLRESIESSFEHIAFGLRALRGARIDRLSKENKVKFGLALAEFSSDSKKVDAVLRKLCRSELLDADETIKERTSSRRAMLKALRAQYPDPWWSENAANPKKY